MNKIINGDSLSVLKELPEKSINMCMTSPPYWALRDYGVEGQLGLEPTFEQYISDLCNIFDEVKRVLRDDGTCWVNLGDTYSNSAGSFDKKDYGGINQGFRRKVGRGSQPNYPDKSLCMIPMRFAIEMVNRGWILRNTIIWHKRNCMPSSASDRFTVDFEYLFFFSKKKKYYFETQREPHQLNSFSRMKRGFTENSSFDYTKRKLKNKIDSNLQYSKHSHGPLDYHPDGRNKRTVWTINPKPFKEAHFAVYPEELCETPIKAGCPVGGIVLDPFFGAGTTGVVALKQSKKFLGIELNKEYIEIAKARLKPFLEQRKLI